MTRTAPVMASESPGIFQTSALWNAQVKALGDFVLNYPVFCGYQASVQTLTTSVWGPISQDSELFDSDGGHSTVTNNSRYFPQVAGLYLPIGIVAFANNTTGLRGSKLSKNGTTILGSTTYAAPGPSVGSTSLSMFPVQCAVGDYIDLFGFQASGGNLSTANNGEACSSLTVFWQRN